MAVWVEELTEDSFKICLQEVKTFDGLHKGITIVSKAKILFLKTDLYPIAKLRTARGHSRAFDTHAVSYQNITTQKVLLENRRLAHLSRTGIN